ncbi:MAG: 60 kDa inner membrane insertion protein [Candidatus Yanofskybacteria bacterium GW2011_GWF1_44_227]|uniref:60 kDa inner membrane insertion protein n=1 Tax=Candidatus Yanofskybacteria bacterium GW2011_GWE2_40_11 TaxID=1619033 RepID=A0A0G0TS19_9BACT|nr:MAG: 60 kDa inner membrane insertion protein [Candidatus Yanofskybacteria bacterium GW2011_GWE1_40_10]KKR40642.1 MAG: 60 kDa inner membrane insertion protein [Candidatus Yanofskybacteria bacterium GW2011_GWE2_40_11]KKT15797.1 MAG: 60 kDa inner membrane insertion protein [Candidatus Yanofskybacteria bacterium GW2011_GWF2_43_596]KKT53487.1 MAG: 60 kDa inner membrane insertion protein [Candidatus Yanofskybacteria bacterium GW2011_GWF1_44_227]OGN35893.1 MAG: hypothetical protein A2241_03905 [Can
MSMFFNEIIYRPLLNIAIVIYNALPGNDFGIAIVVMTVLVRLALMPLSLKALRSQQALNKINPKLNEIKEKFKDNKAAQSEAIMKLYKEEGVNPLAGCLPLLIQLPLLFALYKVFAVGLTESSLSLLYSFISRPDAVSHLFLGIVDITQRSIPLTVLAGVLQFIQGWQQKNSVKGTPGVGKEVAALNSQMLYFLPVFIIIIGWKMPAGLIVYWVATTAFSIFEQFYIKSKKS